MAGSVAPRNWPQRYESSLEKDRVRKCVIYLYLEDGTIQMVEHQQENSGIPQVVVVSCHGVCHVMACRVMSAGVMSAGVTSAGVCPGEHSGVPQGVIPHEVVVVRGVCEGREQLVTRASHVCHTCVTHVSHALTPPARRRCTSSVSLGIGNLESEPRHAMRRQRCPASRLGVYWVSLSRPSPIAWSMEHGGA